MTANQEEFLTRDRALEALTRLGGHLVAAGLVGDVYRVGGAAMVLAYGAERRTRDVDAVFAPTDGIYEAARIVGDDLGLPEGWLNDAARGFVPGPDPGALQVLAVPGLRVTAAAPEFLLGMKLLATRPEQDRGGIAQLARLLNRETRGEVLAVMERLYPETLCRHGLSFWSRGCSQRSGSQSARSSRIPQPGSARTSEARPVDPAVPR